MSRSSARPAPLEGPRRRLLDCQSESPERAIARGTREVIADIGYPPEITYPRPRPVDRMLVAAWLAMFLAPWAVVAGVVWWLAR